MLKELATRKKACEDPIRDSGTNRRAVPNLEAERIVAENVLAELIARIFR